MEFFSWIIAIPVFLLSIWYWIFNKKPGYWEGKDIRTIPRSSTIGFIKNIFTKPLHEFVIEPYRNYGRLYGYYEAGKPSIAVGDPNLLRYILLKDFQYFMNPRDITVGDSIADNMLPSLTGEKWKRMRSIVSATFSTGKIKRMTSIILDSAETLCQNFAKAAKEGSYVNMKSVFGAFTMDAIASSAFGTKLDSHNDPNNKFVQVAKTVFNNKMPLRLIFIIFFPRLSRLFGVSLFSTSAITFFRDVTLNIIKERRKTGQVRNDFLQLLMEVSELGADSTSTVNVEEQEDESSGFKLSGKHKKLSQDELLAQCIVFFLAGYETVSTALSFVAYEMALNPECQEKLIKEIDTVMADSKGEITYEGIQNMQYLDNVVSETLRMYPPSITVQRECTKDYKIPDTDLIIKKGMVMMVPVYAIHHDEEFYPEPEKFNPDRFKPEAKLSHHQYTYLPFGAGPRMCVGNRFALMEMKLCLAKLFSQFRVKRCPKTKVPLEYQLGQVMLQPKEILLAVEKRT